MSDSPLTETLIARQVRAFYTAARDDDLLGPVFNTVVRNWDAHLDRICDFWSGILLRTGRYDGMPMRAHAPLPIDDAHFARWLALWAETAHAQCPPDIAEHLVALANRIGASLAHGVAIHHGRLPPHRPAA